jgi:hypothetical protein
MDNKTVVAREKVSREMMDAERAALSGQTVEEYRAAAIKRGGPRSTREAGNGGDPEATVNRMSGGCFSCGEQGHMARDCPNPYPR